MRDESENRIVVGDNLSVMRGMPADSVDLIYLDPPFNSNKNYAAPMGSEAQGTEFMDTWNRTGPKSMWLEEIKKQSDGLAHVAEAAGFLQGDGTMSYLVYMAIRLLEMKRLLKDTGSIYLHCDPTASHYLKLLMDGVFGADNFRNEIVWSYRRWGSQSQRYQKMHDILLFYGKSRDGIWNWPMEPKAEGTPKFKRWNTTDPETGKKKTHTDKSVAVTETNMRDVWEIPRIQSTAKERLGYPTQKPIALLERIIKASSNKGDVVLDPFAGSGTTCVVASRYGRGWIGIDISENTGIFIRKRMKKELGASMISTSS